MPKNKRIKFSVLRITIDMFHSHKRKNSGKTGKSGCQLAVNSYQLAVTNSRLRFSSWWLHGYRFTLRFSGLQDYRLTTKRQEAMIDEQISHS